MSNLPLMAQIAGFIVCLAGIVCLVFGAIKDRTTAINVGKWAIIVGLTVLVGGKLASLPPAPAPLGCTSPVHHSENSIAPSAGGCG